MITEEKLTRGQERRLQVMTPTVRRAIEAAPTGSERTRRPADSWSKTFFLLGVFLALFGLLNFLELPLGWKDRVPQITRYLATTVHAGPEWVQPVLWSQKALEGALGVIALIALLKRDYRWLVGSIVGWMVVFVGMTVMDVWAADRVELQEHTVYFAAFGQLLMLVVVVRTAAAVKDWLRRPALLAGAGAVEA